MTSRVANGNTYNITFKLKAVMEWNFTLEKEVMANTVAGIAFFPRGEKAPIGTFFASTSKGTRLQSLKSKRLPEA